MITNVGLKIDPTKTFYKDFSNIQAKSYTLSKVSILTFSEMFLLRKLPVDFESNLEL